MHFLARTVLTLFMLICTAMFSAASTNAQSTEEPSPANVPIIPFIVPTVYDSFIFREFDNSFNNNLWLPDTLNDTEITQQDGMLRLSGGAFVSNDTGVTLRLSAWRQSRFKLFESRLLIRAAESSGTNGIISINVYIEESPQGSLSANPLGWGQIGVVYRPNGLAVRVSTDSSPTPIVDQRIEDEVWHTIAIEFDSPTNSLLFLLDGEVVATVPYASLFASVPSTSEIRLVPAVQLWHAQDTQLTGYIDYVRISES